MWCITRTATRLRMPDTSHLVKKDVSFDHFLNEQLKDPKVKAEYDALEPEFAFIQALIDSCIQSDPTQHLK